MYALEKIVRVLDGITVWTARICFPLLIPLMGVLVYEVFVRKLFIAPTIWAMDTSYMINGLLGMMGAVYALYRGGHIAIDFISDRWSLRTRATVNAIFYIICFFPGMSIFLWFGSKFAYASWLEKERAITSAWMPPIYPLKMLMVVAIVFLILQGISEFLKNLHVVLRGEQL